MHPYGGFVQSAPKGYEWLTFEIRQTQNISATNGFLKARKREPFVHFLQSPNLGLDTRFTYVHFLHFYKQRVKEKSFKALSIICK